MVIEYNFKGSVLYREESSNYVSPFIPRSRDKVRLRDYVYRVYYAEYIPNTEHIIIYLINE